MTARTPEKETVLVLDEELERRVRAAARLVGVNPTEFLVRAILRGTAEALGEVTEPIRPDALTGGFAAHQRDIGAGSHGRWAIRPTQGRVMRVVAEASGVSIGTIVGFEGSPAVGRARAVAAYLLCRDAGLSTLDAARVLHRKTNTVQKLIAGVEHGVNTKDARAHLLERVRRLFKNGLSSGLTYPPEPSGRRATKLLPGLLACRLAADLTQPELAERAGVARETLARLERMRRRAQPETVAALARALGLAEASLTAATEELPAILRPDR